MPATTTPSASTILLLATDNNHRGDLFTRLGKDLFFALGYDELRLDVHKAGRELDIIGQHRHEARALVAEFKATKARIGGDDLNKFLGALTRERGRGARVAGYFVSLGGFTETARQQEMESQTGAGGTEQAIILLDTTKVIAELERSGQLLSLAAAMEQAGRCRQHAQVPDGVVDGACLLGTELGYVWAVFYAHHKQRTHFALIHADGTPLAQAVAQQLWCDELLKANPDWHEAVKELQYLAPPEYDAARRKLADSADLAYRTWLAEECGYMQLDGLPTDADLGSSRPRLERLFVPLRAYLLPQADAAGQEAAVWGAGNKEKPLPIGTLLADHPCLALLAAPGGGKSTLLKRLATAYAMPERLNQVADHLPTQNWLPLLLRCRDLGQQARQPILSLLQHICQCAAMTPEQSTLFQETIHTALRAGRVLLLVDGLDELSDSGTRQLFAQNLRTFVGMFPGTRLLLTSREAGFRAVAGVVASLCRQLRMAPLDDEDIATLCQHWYREVYPDDAARQREAEQLAATICENERIRKLAENPLLLTTLLVVKRSTRELPRKRADLYKSAISVLVRTWNTEGYEPLDEEIAVTQLCFIACAMMLRGVQKLPRPELLAVLKQARRELEEELRNVTQSPAQFIDRIELRSSLLMQTGHEQYEGELQPVYEFRHLTFQEYLTALGLVNEHYPGRSAGLPLEDLLEPHFEEESWQEVVPLAAALGKRKTDKLMARLVAVCDELQWDWSNSPNPVHLLRQCVTDRVQVTTPTLKAAYLQIGRGLASHNRIWVQEILTEDRVNLFYATVVERIWQVNERWAEYIGTMGELALWQFQQANPPPWREAAMAQLANQLMTSDATARLAAALVCMKLAHGVVHGLKKLPLEKHWFTLLQPGLVAMLVAENVPEQVACAWSFACLRQHRLLAEPLPASCLPHWFKLWQQHSQQEYSRYFAWAMASQPLASRDTFAPTVWGDCDDFLRQQFIRVGKGAFWYGAAALVVMWYQRAPLTDAELVDELVKHDKKFGNRTPTMRELLANLGEAGQAVLAKWGK
jgi:hypothetical protein